MITLDDVRTRWAGIWERPENFWKVVAGDKEAVTAVEILMAAQAKKVSLYNALYIVLGCIALGKEKALRSFAISCARLVQESESRAERAIPECLEVIRIATRYEAGTASFQELHTATTALSALEKQVGESTAYGQVWLALMTTEAVGLRDPSWAASQAVVHLLRHTPTAREWVISCLLEIVK